jgi:hypothetical protein
MSDIETNISGISENLSNSIVKEKDEADKKDNKRLLTGRKIAISVSESEEIESLGLSDDHIADISIELARYLLVSDAVMLYAGDLRRGGFTEFFSEMSYQYRLLKDKGLRFVNYFPFPASQSLTVEVKAEFLKKQVDAKIVPIPNRFMGIDQTKSYFPAEVADRYVIAECLTDMRIKMASESDARIVLGGRQTGYIGYYPGVIEEAYYSLKSGKPLYILGGFGGAAKTIISIITGKIPEYLTNDFQFQDENNRRFKAYIDENNLSQFDYSILTQFFQQFNVASIAGLNGLSTDDNQILFESTNIYEIIFLVFKGLKNLYFDK